MARNGNREAPEDVGGRFSIGRMPLGAAMTFAVCYKSSAVL